MSQYNYHTGLLDPATRSRDEVYLFGDKLTPSGSLLDSFGRLRVSNPYTMFDCQHVGTISNKFSYSTAGTANTQYLVNESTVAYNVGTASGDKVYGETKTVMAYQPGKSLLTFQTFVFNTPKTNLRQRIGIFDTLDGVFLEQAGTTLNLVLRGSMSGSPVETRVPQSEWNVDKFDGTGYSTQSAAHNGPTRILDVTKANIFWMDIEWLGVGDVRCGFVVDGIPHVAHIFQNDNMNTSVYMKTACLPLRYELENTGTTASASQLKQICCSVSSEGGLALDAIPRAISRSSYTLGAPGSSKPVFSTRLKSTRLNSVVVPDFLTIFVASNDTVKYNVWVGATATNGTWANTDAYTALEYNSTLTTANTTGALLVVSGFASQGSPITIGTVTNLSKQYQRLITGAPVEILVEVIPISSNPTIHANYSWIDLV